MRRLSSHSSDQTGALGEDMPMSVKLWEEVIDFETSINLNNPNSRWAREERRCVEWSVTGQMAPLGETGDGVDDQGVPVRTEISPNDTRDGVTGLTDDIGVGAVEVGREALPIEQRKPPRQRSRRNNGRRGHRSRSGRSSEEGRGTHVVDPPVQHARINRTTIPGGRHASDGGYHIRDFGYGNSNLFAAVDNLVSSITAAPMRTFSDIRKDLVEERIRLASTTNEQEISLSERYILILMTELHNYERSQNTQTERFN